jgi:hypothetical protein
MSPKNIDAKHIIGFNSSWKIIVSIENTASNHRKASTADYTDKPNIDTPTIPCRIFIIPVINAGIPTTIPSIPIAIKLLLSIFYYLLIKS